MIFHSFCFIAAAHSDYIQQEKETNNLSANLANFANFSCWMSFKPNLNSKNLQRDLKTL